MNKSFYVYMMRYRDDKNNKPFQQLAKEMFDDHGFPKHAKDYSDISHYLEMSGQYNTPLSIFDAAWESYIEHE